MNLAWRIVKVSGEFMNWPVAVAGGWNFSFLPANWQLLFSQFLFRVWINLPKLSNSDCPNLSQYRAGPEAGDRGVTAWVMSQPGHLAKTSLTDAISLGESRAKPCYIAIGCILLLTTWSGLLKHSHLCGPITIIRKAICSVSVDLSIVCLALSLRTVCDAVLVPGVSVNCIANISLHQFHQDKSLHIYCIM